MLSEGKEDIYDHPAEHGHICLSCAVVATLFAQKNPHNHGQLLPLASHQAMLVYREPTAAHHQAGLCCLGLTLKPHLSASAAQPGEHQWGTFLFTEEIRGCESCWLLLLLLSPWDLPTCQLQLSMLCPTTPLQFYTLLVMDGRQGKQPVRLHLTVPQPCQHAETLPSLLRDGKLVHVWLRTQQ